MVYGVVYLIWNMVNGKKYVGQTITFDKRINEHKYGDQYIDRAIKKYGWENFRCGVIRSCSSKAEMDYWEKFFIAALKSKKPNGYNCTDGGEGIVGLKHTPEHNAKISAALTGKQLSPEHCANIAEGKKGKTHSPEHNAKIGATLKGVPKSPEHRTNIVKAQRGDSPYKNLLSELDTRHLSYKRLAKLFGVASQNISRKMLGQRNFTARDKAKLAEIFGKPIEYLMFKEELL